MELITACMLMMSCVLTVTESLVIQKTDTGFAVQLNQDEYPVLFKHKLISTSDEQNRSPPEDLAVENRANHPNASGFIIPRHTINHPNASGWIIPRERPNHPNATGVIIPRSEFRSADLSGRNLPDFISRDSENRHPNPLSRQNTQYLGCGSYTVARGAYFQIRTKNYPFAYPKGYKCIWTFTGSADMVLNLDCPDFQLPLCNTGTAAVRKRCTQNNNLLISDHSQELSYYGAKGPRDITTEGNYLSLTLRTLLLAKGFSCSVEAISTETTTNSIDAITSGNFSPCDCGADPSSFGRIVGGKNTAEGRWPWVGGLAPRDTSEVFCGATLIHPLWAVTAAHCFKSEAAGPLIDLLLGAYDLDHPSSNQQRIKILSLHIHENYNKATENNDIAILRLSTAAVITNKVGLACLPKENEPYVGITAVAAGWGQLEEGGVSSTVLQEVQLHMITKVDCADVYGAALSSTMICAYDDGKDTCEGDSGGGLMWHTSSGKWVLGGVVSWGYGCARPGIPGVYTETSKYLSWIRGITGMAQCSNVSQPSNVTSTTTRPTTTITQPNTTTTRPPATTTQLSTTTTRPPTTTTRSPTTTRQQSTTTTRPPTTTTQPPTTTTRPPTTTTQPNTTTTRPLKTCKCGLTYKRIVGGIETSVNEYPWEVGLVRVGSNTPFCGASIVGRRYILTAAHCTQAMSDNGWRTEALVGAHHTSASSSTPYFARIPLELIIQHPQYDTESLRNDISLIKLASNLSLDADPRLAPVCLPTPPSKLYTGANAVVSGWGRLTEGGTQPQTLQKVWLPVISNKDCEASYPGSIFSDSLCAGYPQGGKDSCQGDSGGPLVTEDNAVMVQIGVVSWGAGCARPGKPGVYARVSEYLSWIQSVKGSLDPCA